MQCSVYACTRIGHGSYRPNNGTYGRGTVGEYLDLLLSHNLNFPARLR